MSRYTTRCAMADGPNPRPSPLLLSAHGGGCHKQTRQLVKGGRPSCRVRKAPASTQDRFGHMQAGRRACVS